MKNKQENNPLMELQQYSPNHKPLSRSEHRKLLLDLLSRPEKELDDEQKNLVEFLKVRDITPLLNRKGKVYSVKSGKKDRRKQKPKQCFKNSGRMMSKGYGYVEGVCTDIRSGYTFTHSWNVDKEGNHLDFTLDDTENYEYLGIIIPVRIVYEVLSKIEGGTWCSVLVHYKKF